MSNKYVNVYTVPYTKYYPKYSLICCYHCCDEIDYRDINNWGDDRDDTMCPVCREDALIPIRNIPTDQNVK